MKILNNQWSSSLNKRTEDTFLQGQPLTEVKILTYELCAILRLLLILHFSSSYFTDICEYFTSGRGYIFINVPLVFILSGNFTMKKMDY